MINEFMMQGGPLDGECRAIQHKNDPVFVTTANPNVFAHYVPASHGAFVFVGYSDKKTVDEFFTGKRKDHPFG